MTNLPHVVPTPPQGHEITLFPEQEAAAEKVVDWLGDPNGPQLFTLAGYAGTGKTTVAGEIVGRLGVAPLWAAPTNRAARILSGKTGHSATTLHALLVRPDGEDPETGELFWEDNGDHLVGRLLVVDEATMVDAEMVGRLLERWPGRILAIGDPAQLPPVKEDVGLLMAKPDAILTDVRRQTAGSTVLHLATALRDTENVLGNVLERADRLLSHDWHGADQVIVATNLERWRVIHALRRERGVTPGVPVPGDRLIVRATNRNIGLLNADQIMAETVLEGRDATWKLEVSSVDDPRRQWQIKVPRCAFESYDGERRSQVLVREERGYRMVHATFADAITAHSAQGGEWPHVHIAEPARGDTRRWFYTAVTRAQETITLGRIS